MKEWTCVVSSPSPGEVVVSMYEITEGKSNHEREIIRRELSVHDMLSALDVLQSALGYHLRMMS